MWKNFVSEPHGEAEVHEEDIWELLEERILDDVEGRGPPVNHSKNYYIDDEGSTTDCARSRSSLKRQCCRWKKLDLELDSYWPRIKEYDKLGNKYQIMRAYLKRAGKPVELVEMCNAIASKSLFFDLLLSARWPRARRATLRSPRWPAGCRRK
jgi:hypothetical protein